ncbi:MULTISPECIES: hypothetical protein [Rhodococcus erythropolis group]|uniref:Uncharacterized protein n=1 Tax=Rhodococcus erythropolis TaxID=1833 RepID=A0A8I0ZZF3_RHOER|nr:MULTISPECIES: hypothetical protein [Rhodococcus erythropolis group]MBH5144222.1 hypothetical protein [Rhodococcus erythropolis]MDJ0434678.1 hypothetical protein [Rhodococcus qingshengii]QEM25737.1 hypothetical protein D6M20_02550 [Rhodococcus qingshengii]
MTDNEPARVTRPITLEPLARTASGLLGLASSVAGGYSVFANTNQAGSTALLLIGGLFLLMMLTGRVPERIGKDGIVHDRDVVDTFASRESITQLMESESEVVREAVAETYLRNREEFSQWISGMIANESGDATVHAPPARGSAASYSPRILPSDMNLLLAREINLAQKIEKLLTAEFGAEAVDREPRSGFGIRRFRPDAVVTLPTGKRIAVEAKVGPPQMNILIKTAAAAKDAGLDGLVVVNEAGLEVPSASFEGGRIVAVKTDDTRILPESAEAVANAIKRYG